MAKSSASYTTSVPGVTGYDTARSGRLYMAQWVQPLANGYKKHCKKRGFTTIRDAAAYKRKMEEANDRGVGIDPAASRITISQLSEEWLDMRKSVVKTRTWESEESHHRVHIVPYWGDTTIGSIRFSAIQAWVAELTGEGLAPKTVHNIYADFAALIRYALRDRLITVNPCDGIKLPKIPPREMVCLTPEELGRLADASGYYKPYILTLGTCGLRDGEARALRVRNIDFDKRRIAVESTFERTNTEGWIENPPKTWERRDVAVPAVTIDALRELCADKAPDDFVFRQPNGEMMPQQKRAHVAKKEGAFQWFGRAIVDSGVPSLRIHDLRHTTASIAISAGANVKAVQKLLGHKDAKETLNTYASLFERDLDEVANRMNAAMTTPPAPAPSRESMRKE